MLPIEAPATLPYCLLDFRGLLRNERKHRAQVLEIEKRQPLIVGDAEGDIEHAFLGLVETKQPRQQQRPHFRDGGADRVALLAVEIPEHRRELVRLIFDPQILGALDEGLLGLADRRDAGQIALDVGGKDRDAGLEKPSARTCKVTVLPVPVAPVTSPCRLASASVKYSGFSPFPTKIVLPSSSTTAAASGLAAGFAAGFALDFDFAVDLAMDHPFRRADRFGTIVTAPTTRSIAQVYGMAARDVLSLFY